MLITYINDWDDYFDGSSTLYEGKTERITSFETYAYVKNSNFVGICIAAYGGAIYWSTSSDKKLLVEETAFTMCSHYTLTI